jgi:hypothetical protein
VIRCWNWVVCGELTFTPGIVLSALNLRSLLKMCCLQWICDLLPKLSCLQQIIFRCWRCVVCSEFVIRCWNWVVCSELAFAAESVLAVANQRLLSKLCCLQRKCDSLPKLSCLQRISIRCRKRVGCNDKAFATKIEVPVVKKFSLPNCAAPAAN